MTLFKKVFQNQSQPASSEDVLDEDALRKAFMEAEETEEPLKLDPFECIKQKEEYEEEADLLDSDNEMDDEDSPNAFEDGPKQLEGALDVINEEALVDMEPEPNSIAVDWQAEEISNSDATLEDDGCYQSDEEIAMFLDRAMTAEIPAEREKTGAPDENEISEETLNLEEIEDQTEKSERDGEEPEAASEEEMDVTQFAQQQIAALDVELPVEVDDDADAQSAEPDLSSAAVSDFDAVPSPAVGRAGRRVGRVKSRLLGFNRTGDVENDPFGQAPEATASAQREKYPVGWLVIVEGPGVGHSFSIFTGASMIGRGEDQVIRLDFGDNSISRNNHAAIAYDEEQNKFFIGHGGKSNIIRRNARPVLSTEELNHADLIRIGETTLRFVALCGSDFQWKAIGQTHAEGV